MEGQVLSEGQNFLTGHNWPYVVVVGNPDIILTLPYLILDLLGESSFGDESTARDYVFLNGRSHISRSKTTFRFFELVTNSVSPGSKWVNSGRVIENFFPIRRSLLRSVMILVLFSFLPFPVLSVCLCKLQTYNRALYYSLQSTFTYIRAIYIRSFSVNPYKLSR